MCLVGVCHFVPVLIHVACQFFVLEHPIHGAPAKAVGDPTTLARLDLTALLRSIESSFGSTDALATAAYPAVFDRSRIQSHFRSARMS